MDFTDRGYISMLAGGGETLSYDNPLVELHSPGLGLAHLGQPARNGNMDAARRVTLTAYSTLTISLSSPASTFGLEIEPDNFSVEETTADFYSGSTLAGTIDLFPNGNAGALLFAASTATDPFTSVVITNLTGDDFAIAQQRFTLASAAPCPSLRVSS